MLSGYPSNCSSRMTAQIYGLFIEFSSLLGISQGRLSEIEKNITKPSAETLIALRKKFGVDLNELLSDLD